MDILLLKLFGSIFIKLFDALIIIGPLLTFIATISMLASYEKKVENWPSAIKVIIVVLCLLSTVGTSSLGVRSQFPTEEMVESQEEEQASIENAIENAYEQGYSSGYEVGYADGSLED